MVTFLKFDISFSLLPLFFSYRTNSITKRLIRLITDLQIEVINTITLTKEEEVLTRIISINMMVWAPKMMVQIQPLRN